MPDPDLEIRRARSSRPLDKGGQSPGPLPLDRSLNRIPDKLRRERACEEKEP